MTSAEPTDEIDPTTVPVPEPAAGQLIVESTDLRKGDRLVDTMGPMVVAGTPTLDPEDPTVALVPLEGSDEPVRFAATIAWRVDRP